MILVDKSHHNMEEIKRSCCCSSEGGTEIFLFVINGKQYGMEQRRTHFQASNWPQDESLSMEIWTRDDCLGFFFMTSAADIDFLRISANPPGCTGLRTLRFLKNETIFIGLQVFGPGTGKTEEMTLIKLAS